MFSGRVLFIHTTPQELREIADQMERDVPFENFEVGDNYRDRYVSRTPAADEEGEEIRFCWDPRQGRAEALKARAARVAERTAQRTQGS